MSLPPRTVRVWSTLAALRSAAGPLTAHYALVLDAVGALYRFAVGSAAAEDTWTAIEPTGGGGDGAWLRVREDVLGANITGTATVTVGGKPLRRILAGALSASATLTLSMTNAEAGDWFYLVRLDTGAYTVAVVNGGAGGGTLTTLPVSQRARVVAYCDGTDWLLVDAHVMI